MKEKNCNEKSDFRNEKSQKNQKIRKMKKTTTVTNSLTKRDIKKTLNYTDKGGSNHPFSVCI